MRNSAGKAVGSGGYVGKLAGAPGGAGILLKRSAKSFTKDFTILLEGSGFCCTSTCICKSKAIASLLLDSFKLTIPRCFILGQHLHCFMVATLAELAPLLFCQVSCQIAYSLRCSLKPQVALHVRAKQVQLLQDLVFPCLRQSHGANLIHDLQDILGCPMAESLVQKLSSIASQTLLSGRAACNFPKLSSSRTKSCTFHRCVMSPTRSLVCGAGLQQL